MDGADQSPWMASGYPNAALMIDDLQPYSRHTYEAGTAPAPLLTLLAIRRRRASRTEFFPRVFPERRGFYLCPDDAQMLNLLTLAHPLWGPAPDSNCH